MPRFFCSLSETTEQKNH